MISVLTPSYGYARFLETALASVDTATFQHQHVVVDGAAPDGSAGVLSRWPQGSLDWISEPDAGQSDALNKALRMARGDVIGWLNADEFYLPGALDRVEEAFRDNPEIDVLYGDVLFVDETGHLLRLLPGHPWSHHLLTSRGCTLTTASTFIRRGVLPVDPFCVDYRMVMDWDLFLKLRSRGARFKHIPVPLAAFRVHEARVTAGPMNRNSKEHQMIRATHHIPAGTLNWRRHAGDLIHVAAKTGFRARRRQVRLSGLAGIPLLVNGRVLDESWDRIREELSLGDESTRDYRQGR